MQSRTIVIQLVPGRETNQWLQLLRGLTTLNEKHEEVAAELYRTNPDYALLAEDKKAVCRKLNIARSTMNDIAKTLIKCGLIKKEGPVYKWAKVMQRPEREFIIRFERNDSRGDI